MNVHFQLHEVFMEFIVSLFFFLGIVEGKLTDILFILVPFLLFCGIITFFSSCIHDD